MKNIKWQATTTFYLTLCLEFDQTKVWNIRNKYIILNKWQTFFASPKVYYIGLRNFCCKQKAIHKQKNLSRIQRGQGPYEGQLILSVLTDDLMFNNVSRIIQKVWKILGTRHAVSAAMNPTRCFCHNEPQRNHLEKTFYSRNCKF